MGKINILSKSAAEKIAAGEVVERPANAIKEMVENSIDAGAKSVTVEIRRGGIAYIRITDNGGGILPDDAERAFMRHATSKIKDETDLEHITTLGFRGEALCSIASVSRTELLTKTPQNQMGTRMVVEGGETVIHEEMGCPDGTTVTVENLFYNTPARMKFLKKDSAEAALVTEVCQRLALARPDISLRLVRDGKEIFFTPGNNSLTDAVRCLWGKDFAENMAPVSYGEGAVRVSGLAGRNNLSRPSRSSQLFFVNGRWVVNRALSLALADAYKNELMTGRFPVAVLNIELPPSLCDVNVHPTKTEIKFADEKSVYGAVYWAVKNMLGTQAGAREVRPAFTRGSYKLPVSPAEAKQLSAEGKFKKYTPAPLSSRDYVKTSADKADTLRVELNPILPQKQIERLNEETELKLRRGEIKSPVISKAGLFTPIGEKKPDIEPEKEPEQKPDKTEVAEETRRPEIDEAAELPVKIIGQLFSTYILAEGGGELILIDQHAAHERIRYEELRSHEEAPAMQLLLLPQSVALSPQEMETAAENREFLWSMGFDIEDIGGGTVLMRSVPADCEGSDGEGLLSELIAVLMGGSGGTVADRRDRAMYTLACHSAIRANKELSPDEAERLVRRALALEGISTCPHGRPISVKITKYQIEKMFKRIV